MSHASYSENRPSYGGTRSDFMRELNDAIRQNPIPAALVGVGILWLFAGGRNVMLGGASRSVVSGVGRAAEHAGGAAYRGVREATGRVADGIHRVAQSAGEAGAQVTDAVRSAADAIGSAVTRTGETVSEAASDATDRMWSQGGDEASATTQFDRSAGDGIGNFRRAQDTLADLFAKQPLMLGAVGVAIGAAIAASVPASDAENRLMGDTADAVKDRAGELWNESKKRGADLASKGLDEAERQGLTAESAGAAARNIASKVVGLAERAGDDIVDRTRR